MKPCKNLFESKLCTRCGGSGSFSFNLMHGSMCYGCSGSGWMLTKRGAAAQAFFRESEMVPVSGLKVGDVIRTSGVTHGGASYDYNATVTAIEIETVSRSTLNGVEQPPYTALHLEHPKLGKTVHCTFPSCLVRLMGGDRKARIAAALAYQATLTKAGKPGKRKKAQA